MKRPKDEMYESFFGDLEASDCCDQVGCLNLLTQAQIDRGATTCQACEKVCDCCGGTGIRLFEVSPASTKWREEQCGCGATPQRELKNSGRVTWK